MKRLVRWTLAIGITMLVLFHPGLHDAKATTWSEYRSDHAAWIERDAPAHPYLGAISPEWLEARADWRATVRLRTARFYHRFQDIRAAELASPSYGASNTSNVHYTGDIPDLIRSIFGPTGDAAVSVAYCESKFHPNSINPYSGAAGLFQFLPSWWDGPDDIAFTDDDQWNPLDPVVNAQQAYAASSGGTDWSAWSCKP